MSRPCDQRGSMSYSSVTTGKNHMVNSVRSVASARCVYMRPRATWAHRATENGGRLLAAHIAAQRWSLRSMAVCVKKSACLVSIKVRIFEHHCLYSPVHETRCDPACLPGPVQLVRETKT